MNISKRDKIILKGISDIYKPELFIKYVLITFKKNLNYYEYKDKTRLYPIYKKFKYYDLYFKQVVYFLYDCGYLKKTNNEYEITKKGKTVLLFRSKIRYEYPKTNFKSIGVISLIIGIIGVVISIIGIIVSILPFFK